MNQPRNPATYRSGQKKGLPKFCECGGRLIYSFSFNRVWSGCDTCTPVQKIDLSKLRPKK